jgi:hypothetical protein
LYSNQVQAGIAVECQGKLKVYSIGKWFGVEGLLLEGNCTYEIRALNYLTLQFVNKEGIHEIFTSGDYPK